MSVGQRAYSAAGFSPASDVVLLSIVLEEGTHLAGVGGKLAAFEAIQPIFYSEARRRSLLSETDENPTGRSLCFRLHSLMRDHADREQRGENEDDNSNDISQDDDSVTRKINRLVKQVVLERVAACVVPTPGYDLVKSEPVEEMRAMLSKRTVDKECEDTMEGRRVVKEEMRERDEGLEKNDVNEDTGNDGKMRKMEQTRQCGGDDAVVDAVVRSARASEKTCKGQRSAGRNTGSASVAVGTGGTGGTGRREAWRTSQRERDDESWMRQQRGGSDGGGGRGVKRGLESMMGSHVVGRGNKGKRRVDRGDAVEDAKEDEVPLDQNLRDGALGVSAVLLELVQRRMRVDEEERRRRFCAEQAERNWRYELEARRLMMEERDKEEGRQERRALTELVAILAQMVSGSESP